jgi:hypothetical protein
MARDELARADAADLQVLQLLAQQEATMADLAVARQASAHTAQRFGLARASNSVRMPCTFLHVP